MRLDELEPYWVHPHIFVFRCPHCRVKFPGREEWLSCKRVVMSLSMQADLFECFGLERYRPVACRAEMAWGFNSNDFATMSVTPSLDASASGHWHGYITNGLIEGGI